jgi:hypothetical protein
MSGAPEHKYTDADVRGEPDLVELAKEYLENYFGDFDPLVEAQEYHLRGLEMPTAVVRKVLNCMRHDTEWAHVLPRPGAYQPQRARARLRVAPDPQPEPDPERPYRISFPAIVHWEYGCPKWKGNLHIVSMAQVTWYLPDDPFNPYRRSQDGQRVPHLDVIWACGKRTSDPRLSVDGEDLYENYIKCCKACFGDEE